MSHMGATPSARALVVHPKQMVERRPVGAVPAAKISISHTNTNPTKTTAARHRLALSIHTSLYQRDTRSSLFGITKTNPVSSDCAIGEVISYFSKRCA